VATEQNFNLCQDKKGMYWDLALYIPTVIALISVAFQMWYAGNESFTYLLMFATTFIFLIGFNRIAKTRMMLLASAPVSFVVSKQGVTLTTKSGDEIALATNVRFFSDVAGKSIALSGLDLLGKRQQCVFHRGQFESQSVFEEAKASLRMFK
jgi:hypothetical protein